MTVRNAAIEWWHSKACHDCGGNCVLLDLNDEDEQEIVEGYMASFRRVFDPFVKLWRLVPVGERLAAAGLFVTDRSEV